MYRLLGINSAETFCCCCGKTGLKQVVWLECQGVSAHYGTTCASALLAGLDQKPAYSKAQKLLADAERAMLRGLFSQARSSMVGAKTSEMLAQAVVLGHAAGLVDVTGNKIRGALRR